MKIEILINDPAPLTARRYSMGDTATVLHRQMKLTEKHPHHFEVTLDKYPTIQCGQDVKGLARNCHFHKDEVKIIEE